MMGVFVCWLCEGSQIEVKGGIVGSREERKEVRRRSGVNDRRGPDC